MASGAEAAATSMLLPGDGDEGSGLRDAQADEGNGIAGLPGALEAHPARRDTHAGLIMEAEKDLPDLAVVGPARFRDGVAQDDLVRVGAQPLGRAAQRERVAAAHGKQAAGR